MNRILKHTGAVVLEGALISALVVGLAAGTAFAGKTGGAAGGGKHGGGGTTGGSATIALHTPLDVDHNGNGAPNYGDTITFKVTSSSSTPYVSATCTQNGTLVWSASAGFYPSFPWPGSQNMPLTSPSWTGGAADCVAVLQGTSVQLAFHVAA